MAAKPTHRQADDETIHHVSPRAKRQRTRAKMQPPLTPMIDVTFQLLLFFILTMQFRQPEGQIPQELPKEDVPSPVPVIPININVFRVEKPEVMAHVKLEFPEGRPFTIRKSFEDGVWRDLLVKLQARLKDHPTDKRKVPVVIRPRARAEWSHTINAFYQAKRAGFDIVTFP